MQLDGVKFDLGKYSWIGKAATEARVVMVDAKSPYKTLADMRAAKTPLNWSASGVGSAAYVETRFMIDLLGIPGKIIFGYSGNDELLAIRRGEIQAVVGSPSSYDTFLSSGYGRLAFQIGGKSQEGVPQLRDLVAGESADARAVVALVESQVEIQRFTAGPPASRPTASPCCAPPSARRWRIPSCRPWRSRAASPSSPPMARMSPR